MLAIKVPPLGESITEATVSRWTKREGEAVAAGETLVELETDKITVEVPALKAGVLAKRAKSEGDVVAVNDTLGELDESAVAPVAAPAVPTSAVRSAPAARRLAEESGVDLSTVPRSGRGGVVSKPDVLAAIPAIPAIPAIAATATTATSATSAAPPLPPIARRPPAVAEGARETREKMSTRRKRIAENLLQAQQATAHLTTFNEVDMTAVEALRARMKEAVEKEHGVKLSIMPFFAKATVMALKAFPVVNAQIDGDAIVYRHYVHLGIAVASEAGLVVPNVKDADRLGVLGLGREIAALAQRARDGKLTMDDLTGGTFTISNGGVFGSLVSTPIINHPQSGILGLHKIQERPVAVDGRVEIRPMMYVALSYDHRLIDGQYAVLFLVKLKELIEDPAAMLIE
ncbi:MAG TPA: 2-oxoglutarate dehydrogenase complex dihydrolipoyllysine-residue succinyltransferase [Gemmatimonadaceae bacterium]|nr:2-oxoglutarate dehydrogenase complex dihydrolipoyllysine-residue succinyltransferase [Gemmatimonadaceae bacterium]